MQTRNRIARPRGRADKPIYVIAAPWIGLVLAATFAACGGSSGGDDADAAPLDAPPSDAPPSDAPPDAPPLDAPPPDAPPDAAPDGPALSCEPSGTGAITGSVQGVELSQIVSAWSFEPGNGLHLLIIDEFDNTCNIGNPAPTQDEHLVVVTCEPPAAGVTFSVTPEFPQGPCPGEALAFVFLEEGSGSDIAAAGSGTLEFTEAGACVSGSLSVDFSGEAMAGTFSAIVCP